MPKLVLPIPETYDSVTRPVVYDVARRLFKLTGLPDNTPILYPSAHGNTMQPGSTLHADPADSELAYYDQVTIEVDEAVDQDRLLSTAVLYPDNLFIFHDPRVETMLKPVYSSTEITINFKYRAIDEVKAKRWREQIRVRTSQMRDVQVLDVRYAYQLPPVSMVILEEIHTLMENVAGYGDTFAQWFKNSVTARATVESNLSGKQLQVAVPEHQGRIVGYWDFEGEPEIGSKEDDTDTWTISCAFKFKYDKPVSVVMEYPQMVHNQLIKYREDKLPFNPEQIQKSFSLSAYYFEQFNRTRSLDGWFNGNEGLRFPAWDEFVPNNQPPFFIRIFSGMTALDLSAEGNPNLLMNLDELSEGWSMDDRMKAFVTGEAPYMTQLYNSVFSCNLYAANDLQADGTVRVDGDLNVLTTFDPNPRARFHVWFGLCYNWRLLSPAAWTRLLANYDILVRLIEALWPALPRDRYPKPIGNSNQTSRNSMLGFMSAVPSQTGFKSVETFYVQAVENTNATRR
jgi:hypothetical protein